MIQRLQHITVTFLATLAAYGLYVLLAVPWIEPPERSPADPEAISSPAARAKPRRPHASQLSELFAADAWELNEPKIVETEQGLFLFREYAPQPDGRLELKPCTLVFYSSANRRGGGGIGGRPTVMSAPAGALLQFEGGADTLKAEFGKLRGARLPGDVRIHSPESRPGADDALEIATRNVQIDEQQVWTPHEVDFRFGKSFGSGRDLLIVLAPPQSTGRSRKSLGPAIGGVKTLELVHVDKFHLQAPPSKKTARSNGLTDGPTRLTSGGGTTGGMAAALFADGQPIALEVTCRGSFRIDFDEPSATFDDHVDVVRLADGPGDQLNCQNLTLYFTPREAGKADEFALERLVATGHPAILRAPSADAVARAEYLEYHLRTRRVQARDAKSALLQHGSSQMEARRIEYELASRPGRLGRVWADGPGRLLGRFGNEQTQPLEATWGDKLYVRPHEGSQVVSLNGAATIRYADQNHFTAAELHLWLTETSAERGEASGRFSLEPDRLLAQGGVTIDSPRFSGSTDRVEAWFDGEPRGVDGGVAVSPVSRPRRSDEPRGGSPDAGDPRAPEAASDAAPAQKLDISGRLARLQLRRVGAQTVLQDAAVEGGVRLSEASSGAVRLPLEITGETLQVNDASSGRAIVRILGNREKPAQVAARGMTMTGDAVHLSQSENRVWIRGPGVMQLPTPSPSPEPAGQFLYQNERLAERRASEPLTITWQAGMSFDGATARFEQQVEARARHWTAAGELIDMTAVGELLEAQLNQRIDFSKPPRQGDVALARLNYSGGVTLTARTFRDGAQVAFDRMQLQNLVLEQAPHSPQPNLLHGGGPGWLSTLRFMNSPASGPGAPPSGQGPPPAPRLAFLHVQFARGLEGNLLSRHVTFLDQVQAVYGPVNRWEDQLRPDPRSLGEDGVLLTCAQLTIAEMPGLLPGQRALEMDASGNATAEGRQFAARGGRISYAQSKDMLVLEGDVRSEAELWKLPRSNQVKPDAVARKIMFWRRENRVEVDGARYIDLSRFGQPTPR